MSASSTGVDVALHDVGRAKQDYEALTKKAKFERKIKSTEQKAKKGKIKLSSMQYEIFGNIGAVVCLLVRAQT